MLPEGTRACAGPEMSAYHVEAAIALCHSTASPPDRRRIVGLYDDPPALRASPVARLNRAIALSMVDSVAAAIAELEAVEAELLEYTLLPAVLGGRPRCPVRTRGAGFSRAVRPPALPEVHADRVIWRGELDRVRRRLL